MAHDPIQLWYRADCSKCREAERLILQRDVPVERRDFLGEPPDRAELEALMKKLGTHDPHVMMRTGDDRYRELALDGAPRDALLDVLVAEPALLQRPIAVLRGRALIARPPDRVLDLIDETDADGS